jgi:N-acetyl sugar amidotransferase
MNSRPYQICTRCVMDTSASDITFDEYGVCNYCTEFLSRSSDILFKAPSQRQHELDIFVEKVKRDGKSNAYDCIVGVSGGVDSSTALVYVVNLGLRPLAVHMDNGWNSELAQNNIANLVRSLGVDLYTHVIDWDEYRKLMQAFFDADVIDVELLYDNAMLAVNFQQAAKYGVRYILAGTNESTEGMRIPETWLWFKYDKKNIQALARQFGGTQLKTFPAIGTIDYYWYRLIRKIRWISFLDYFEYNKFDALEMLQLNYGYKPYPYKHYESIFTRFYQGYILPRKFGVDKRRVHLATLVSSRQLAREDALLGLRGVPYLSEQEMEDDKRYFAKKMNWTLAQVEDYIARPAKLHSDYPSEKLLWDRATEVMRNTSTLIRRLTRL